MNKGDIRGHFIAYGALIGFIVGFILDIYELAIFGDVGLGIDNDYIGDFENVSNSYDSNGNPATLYKYAASAATGLSSSASDLAKFALIQVSNSNKNGDSIFGHDGANDPAINSTVRINPENGDAIIVLVTGHKLLASLIGYEWTLWQTGYPDFLMFDRAIDSAFLPIISGVLIIILVLIAVIVMKRRRKISL